MPRRPDVPVAQPEQPSGRYRMGYVPALDGMRALAILLVFGGHLRPGRMGHSGQVGVGVFFALSGFLITTLLMEERSDSGRIGLGAFYLRRAARLLPALYVMVLVLTPVTIWLRHNHHIIGEGVAALLYVANWARIEGLVDGRIIDHTWTLAVEEHFYLFWPLLLIGALKVGGRRLAVLVAGAGTLGALGWRVWLFYHHAQGEQRLQYGSDTRADALLIACAAALLLAGRRPRIPAWLGYLGWLTVVWLEIRPRAHDHFMPTIGFTLLSLAGTVVVLDTVTGTSLVSRALSWRPLVALGRVSYGFYLWHLPVIVLTAGALPRDTSPWLRYPLTFAITLAVTIASYVLVERPFLRWKSRLAQRRRVSSGAVLPGVAVDLGAVASDA